MCERFRYYIKSKRKKLGMTQGQFADFLGVSTTAVCFYERGINTPSLATAEMIVEKLGDRLELVEGI